MRSISCAHEIKTFLPGVFRKLCWYLLNLLNQYCLLFFCPGTLHHQQEAPTTPVHPRRPSFTPDRTPPTTTSCYWARRRSWRRGTVASWTTGSPSRSCWLTARGRPTERKYTTLCSLWPRCDVKTERRKKRRKEGGDWQHKLRTKLLISNLMKRGVLKLETLWCTPKIRLKL